MKQCDQGYIWDPMQNKCVKVTGRYSGTWWGVYHERNGKKKKNGNGKNGNGNGNGSYNGNGSSNGNGNGNGNSNGGSNGGGVSEGTLHKWFKGSKSKDGKGGWVNVVTGGTCASDEPGEGTPKCVSSAKRASMSKAERLSAQRRKKKADPGQQQKTGAAKPTYVSTDKKKMKKEEVEIIEGKDRKGKGSGTKDACYHKVKSRYSVWPSAYASGALVKCRKVGAANWGNKSESVEFSNWRDDFNPTEYEFIDLIKPDPIEVPEPTVEWEDPLDLQEVRRLPKYNKPGNIIEVYLAWRGRTMSIQMFFPQVKKPSRKEVIDQLQKVYPGAKLWSYRIADYDPETPLFQKSD